jgi:DNA repair exonuclease SbcCD ATPase subunit
LDLECSEALSESLSDWGGETGSLVVVSHDRNFCQRISFTHVATVKDGSLVLEERSARESDWSSAALSTQIDVGSSDEEGSSLPTANDTEEMDPAVRKKLYNAPKRIEKLESLIEGLEAKVAGLDDEMMTVGNDVGKLVDLQEAKEKLEASIAEYMDEWEDLEDLP